MAATCTSEQWQDRRYNFTLENDQRLNHETMEPALVIRKGSY